MARIQSRDDDWWLGLEGSNGGGEKRSIRFWIDFEGRVNKNRLWLGSGLRKEVENQERV